MYEKKNKSSQPAPTLSKLASGYRTLSMKILMKNVPFFFKTHIFDGCFGKYRLNMTSCDNIGRCLYVLPTRPVGQSFLVFKYKSIVFFERFLYGNFDMKIIQLTPLL